MEMRMALSSGEYDALCQEAVNLGISLKQLIHSKACGSSQGESRLQASFEISRELSKHREVLNQLIRREITLDQGLVEDDLIRLEQSMTAMERQVADLIHRVLKEEGEHGNTSL